MPVINRDKANEVILPEVVVMAVGEEQTVTGPQGQVATLKRKARTVYFLGTGKGPAWKRGRWGNAIEISEDVRHFRDTGYLPVSEGPSWA